MSIGGQISASVALSDEATIGINSNAEKRYANRNVGFTYTDGVGALQGNQLYQEQRTLGGSPDDLDLNGTALKDVYGNNVVGVRAKAVYIENLSTSNTMAVGAAASNPLTTILNSTGTLTIRPGGFVLIGCKDATGYVITAGTGDILRVNGTSGDKYNIAILFGKS